MGYEFLKSKKKGDIIYEASGYGSLVELELLEDPTWTPHEEYGELFEVSAKTFKGEAFLSGYTGMAHYGPDLNDWPHYAGRLYKLDGTVVQN